MQENPYQSTDTEAPPARGKRPLFTPAGVILGIVAIGITVALLLPSVRSARPVAHRVQCTNNAKMIMLALWRYEEEHGSLPPAYTVDDQGNRLHSWRTLILPYMEQQSLYELIDLTKPWDDPANAKAREVVMEEYNCPSSAVDDTGTSYLAVIGPECVFTGPTGRPLREITGGLEYTIAIIEVPAERSVHWMSPHDISIDEVLEFHRHGRTNHPQMRNAGYLDGHANALDLEIDHEVLRSMLTVADDAPTE